MNWGLDNNFNNLRLNYLQLAKLGAIMLIAVMVGLLVPSLFSADTAEYVQKISDHLLSCLTGKAEFVYSGFVKNLLLYGSILLLLWLIGFGGIAVLPAIAIMLSYGILLGIGINIVFSLGFGYGVLLFVLNMLPANLLIAVALILAVNHIMTGSGSFSDYTAGFAVSLILLVIACWYFSFAGPFLLNLFIKLI